MNITVAVALITALSTLCAAGIASLVSIRIHKQQMDAQRKLADDERREERRKQDREVQRQTYTQFLNEFDQIELKLQDCWSQQVATRQRAFVNAISSFTAFEYQLNMLGMVAPPEVLGPAGVLKDSVCEELEVLMDIEPDAAKAEAVIHEIESESFVGAMSNRHEAKAALLEAMRKQLRPEPVETATVVQSSE